MCFVIIKTLKPSDCNLGPIGYTLHVCKLVFKICIIFSRLASTPIHPPLGVLLVWCLFFLQGNNFHPFREVICYGYDEAISFGCWRTDRSNNIHFPHLKWSWGGHLMKISWCLMDEVTVDLTGMASLSIGNGVRDHLWPIIVKSSKPISELRSGFVRSAHTVMSFFKHLLPYLKGIRVSIVRSAK